MWLIRISGLQGSYNAFTTKRGLYVPHGDVIIFSLACVVTFFFLYFQLIMINISCGQILYAFLLRPDTLPRSYTTWYVQFLLSFTQGNFYTFARIGQAAKVPEECVRINHDLVRNGVFNIKDLDEIVLRPVSRRPIYCSIPPSN